MDKLSTIGRTYLLIFLVVFPSFSPAQDLIKQNSPSEYLVKKGDTLWDIAGIFLQSPWKWPSLWENNQQISNPDLIYPDDIIYLHYRNGKPYLSTDSSEQQRLSPRIRKTDRFTPIISIPQAALQTFVEERKIVEAARISKMPYILAGVGLRELISEGDEVFIKGALDPDFNQYDIYRQGKTYGFESDLASVNTEIIRVGSANVVDRQDDISRVDIVKAQGLIRKSDFLIRSQATSLKPLYYLAAAPAGLKGKVIGAVNDAYQIARYDGVVINLGAASGVYAGHVFNVMGARKSVKDPRTNEMIKISNQKIAELMVVNVFENLSYAIILSASHSISLGDTIETVD